MLCCLCSSLSALFQITLSLTLVSTIFIFFPEEDEASALQTANTMITEDDAGKGGDGKECEHLCKLLKRGEKRQLSFTTSGTSSKP